MKKVLTLMGALSVAGSAMAYDYLWNMSDLSGESWSAGFTKNSLTYNGDVNSSWNNVVKGVVSAVKGSATNNNFSFEVEAGDIITVHAYNLNPTPGKIYFKESSVVSADIDNAGTTLLTVTAGATGTVKVYADADVAITKITVVSAKYEEVMAKLAETRTAIDTEKEGIAKYVTDYPKFYSAVTRQISLKVSDEILKIENKLAEAAAANKVTDPVSVINGDALIAELTTLKGTILPAIISAANDAVDAYKTGFLKSTEYSAAQAALTEANNKDVASGSHPHSMYEKKDGKIVLKATGLNTYMETYAQKYFDDVCDSAKAELDKFPWLQADDSYGSYPTSNYTTQVAQTQNRVENIIARFVYERDNAQNFKDQKDFVNTVANDINDTGLDKPAGFDDLKDNIEALYTLLNKDDNKHVYSNSQITGAVFTTPYGNYNNELKTDTLALIASAKAVQKGEWTKVQEHLNNFSAQITELYTGQPETQAKYEQLFAKLQVSLDVIKNYTTYAQRVTAYATVMDSLSYIDGQILKIWSDSQGDKIAEIVAQNKSKNDSLTNDIADALKQYAEMVNRINGYKTIKGIKDDDTAIDAINAQLANVFEYAYNIETIKKNAATEYEKVKDGSASFDYDTYKSQVDDALANIKTATKTARGEANQAAYTYLTTDRFTEGTLAYADRKLTIAKNNYKTGSKKDSYLASDAVTKIDGLKTTYYTPADNKIKSHWNESDPKDCAIADYVNEIANDLNPIYGKLTEIDNQVNAYDASAAKITGLKIDWSVAKANVDPKYTEVLIPMLNTINEDVTKLEGKLQSYGFDAMNYETDINKEVKRLKDELWKVENYTKYLANEAVLTEIKAAIQAVKIDEINTAKAEVQKLVTEEVKTDYIQKLEDIANEGFTEIENACAKHYNSHDLDDKTVQAQLKGDLATISAQIKKLVEDAKAADKAAQEVPGDVNGDKSVDAADYEAIEYFAVAGDDAELTDEEKALRAKADLNGDGTVNLSDLSEFVKLYQSKAAE